MKKILVALFIITATALTANAQERPAEPGRRKKFSHEQFQAKQREYITEKAQLTAEEADAFFPLFFELQKEKFRIEREARSKVIKERGQKLTDEECKSLLEHTADAKIKTAELEKEYITKYLNVIPAKKMLDIQRAENSFQGYILKTITDRQDGRTPHRREGKRD